MVKKVRLERPYGTIKVKPYQAERHLRHSVFIPLSGKYGEGNYARVLSVDRPHVLKTSPVWYATPGDEPYAVKSQKVNGKRKTIRMHNVVQPSPQGMVTDHIRVNSTLDNTATNLRPVTIAENNANKRTKNKSGLKGAYKRKSGRYDSKFSMDGRSIFIDTYDTAEEAHEAYIYVTEAHGRFIDPSKRKST